MTYRDYFENHSEENLSWCRPYRSENGRVRLAINEGEICGLLIDGNDICGKFDGDEDQLWKMICEAADDEGVLGLYDGYTWREIAMRDFLTECGCADCPFADVCDAMEEEFNWSITA